MLSKNIEETAEIAKAYIENIVKNRTHKERALVVCLSGNLGAGKTAFTKAIARHLGIKETVNSPTFVIMKKYPINLEGYKFMFHLDAYRLKDENELLLLGFEEIINNKEHLVFIEWPENVKKIIPSHANYIYISHKEDCQREFELK